MTPAYPPQRTSAKQFYLIVLGPRLPGLGEVFEIELPPRRERIEVQCVERRGKVALVERTDGTRPPAEEVRSRVISDQKPAALEAAQAEAIERDWEDYQGYTDDGWEDWEGY
jgi:hypothetical protein